MNILNAVKSYILCYFSLSYLVFACESCKTNSKFDKGKTSSESHKKKFIPNTGIDETSFRNDKDNIVLHKKLKSNFNGKISLKNDKDIDDFLWEIMYSYDSGKRNVVKKDKYSNLEEVLQDVLGIKVKIDNNKKAEGILNEIRTNFKTDLLFKVFPEKEVKEKIIELNFDKTQVWNYIKNCFSKIDNATKLFDEEDLKDTDLKYYSFVRFIIEQNKKKEEVKKMIEEYKNKPKPEKEPEKEQENKHEQEPKKEQENEPKHEPEKKHKEEPKEKQKQADVNDGKVNQIYQELEDEYGISGFIEEEAAKDKIRGLNCDRAAINEWIENALINGEQ